MAQSALERAVTIAMADGRLALEGIFLSGEDEESMAAVVAAPHPLYGGSMDSPVVNELAYAFQRGGIASLRFNWRGVGASAGTTSGDDGAADEDYGATTAYLEDTTPAALVAAGYSFGAAAAIRASQRHKRIRRLVLVAPPPALIDPELLAGLALKTLVITGEFDELAAPAALEAALQDNAVATLHVIPGADHFFMSGLADIARIMDAWL